MTNFNNLSNWCGAKPTFFNSRTGAEAAVMEDVIDWNNAEIDQEGLYYYLRNGYASFGKTFVKNVFFRRPWSSDADADTIKDYQNFLDYLNGTSNVESVLECLTRSIQADTLFADTVLLPMSGGLDSRTLAVLLPKTENVSAYSYNLVNPSERCHENGIAKLVCARLGIKHGTVNLKNPYVFADQWFSDLSLSAQAHGMYHYDFYHQIKERTGPGGTVLSGIVGDAWSGKINTKPPKKSEDLFAFGYAHGQSIPSAAIKIKTETTYLNREYSLFEKYWDNKKFRMYYLITTKMMLLRFLLLAARNADFEVASPYLDPRVCANLLNLKPVHWVNRKWQTDWLTSIDMHFSEAFIHWNFSKRNDRVYNWGVSNQRDELLEIDLLGKFIDPSFIAKLNDKIHDSKLLQLNHILVGTPKIGNIFRRLGIQDYVVQMLNWYNILLPVSKVMKAIYHAR